MPVKVKLPGAAGKLHQKGLKVVPTGIGQSKMLAPTKKTTEYAQKILNRSANVGLLRPPEVKMAAPREQVRAYTRKTKKGKTVSVRAHTRRGEEKRISTAGEEMKARQAEDLRLWSIWSSGGKKKKDLRPLLRRFEGLINSRASIYRGKVPIPPAAIDAEFKTQFVKAINAYDPGKGALGTFVYRYLDAAKRFIANFQNVARIPETRIYKIGEFNTAQEHLDEVLGRRPSDKEMSDYLKWPVKEVVRLRSELRQGLIRSQWEEDPSVSNQTEEQQVMDLIRFELSPKEREVFDLYTGFGGKKPITSSGQLAKKTGMSIFKVSRVRRSIADKVSKYLR